MGACRRAMEATTLLVAAQCLAVSLQAQAMPWDAAAGGNDHWYEAVGANEGLSWNDAESEAMARGGYLATITSAAENAFAFSLINGSDDLWEPRVTGWLGPWLGGAQSAGGAEPAGGWEWITGEAWVFTSWAPGEPNNFNGNEERLQFFGVPEVDDTWNDQDALDDRTRAYLVEWDLQPIFTNLQGGLGGTFGEPRLGGKGILSPGGSVSLSLTNAIPGAPALLFIGTTTVELPLKGGTLVPAPDLIVSSIPVSPAGAIEVESAWPAIIPAGLMLYFQYWLPDSGGPAGAAASNAIVGTSS